MHRLTVIGRSLVSGLSQTGVKSTTPLTGTVQTRGNAGGPEKLECFVDGKKVLVDPGTTVLQVRSRIFMFSKTQLMFNRLAICTLKIRCFTDSIFLLCQIIYQTLFGSFEIQSGFLWYVHSKFNLIEISFLTYIPWKYKFWNFAHFCANLRKQFIPFHF